MVVWHETENNTKYTKTTTLSYTDLKYYREHDMFVVDSERSSWSCVKCCSGPVIINWTVTVGPDLTYCRRTAYVTISCVLLELVFWHSCQTISSAVIYRGQATSVTSSKPYYCKLCCPVCCNSFYWQAWVGCASRMLATIVGHERCKPSTQ